MSNPTILIVGTSDTKFEEILFLRDQILTHRTCQTKILDVSHTARDALPANVEAEEIIAPLHEHSSELKNLSRGEYIDKAIEQCLPIVQELVSKGDIQGIISAAGSSGSSLATALMRKACPVGFPKLMVSTMASGDIKHYVEETDITMMYSVVDIAGLNSILRRILSNAAAAVAGMTIAYQKSLAEQQGTTAKRIAITMFGNTTPCVDSIRQIMSSEPHEPTDYEIYVFHATGAGGRAMERLIDEGQIDAVIDLTTTEIPDELFGGVLTAGPDRLEMAAKKGIPMVVSVGACDEVNFGPKASIPEHYQNRNLYEHNPAVTLMRTTKDENKQIGEFIVKKLKDNATKPRTVKVILPEGGVSMIDAPGKPFHDEEADRELFNTIGEGLKHTEIEVLKMKEHINDELFAGQVVRELLDLMGVDPKKYRLANARRRKWSFDHGATVMSVRRSSLVGNS